MVKIGNKSNLKTQITEKAPLEGVRFFAIRTGIKEAVFITGSIVGGSIHTPKNPTVAGITAMMLEEGTKQRDKEIIRDTLESIGANITFSSDTHRTRFNARCLKRDIPLVLELLAEQLRTPALKSRELEMVKKRAIAVLEESRDDTKVQAETRLLQTLYPKEHPNFRHDSATAIMLVKKITRDDIVSFHHNMYGLGAMIIVASGDVNAEKLTHHMQQALSGWRNSPLTITPPQVRVRVLATQEDSIYIPDKASTDIFVGGGAGIREHDADFYALMFGLYVLGGSFFGRLMHTVREKKGLTYGIRSALGGTGNGTDGYWFIWATFAPSLLKTGRSALMEELERFVRVGITKKELLTNKEAITGAFRVGLSTAQGLAAAILANIEQGRNIEHMDNYPAIINALTMARVNGAIKEHVDLNRAVTVSAGTFGT